MKDLEKALKNSKLKKQEYVRILAVKKCKEGTKHKDVSKILDVSLKAIEGWITKYNRCGINGLMTSRPNISNYSKLKYEERKEIEKLLKTKTPKEVDIGQQEYWDIPMLKRLVKKKFGIEYKAHSTYTKLFKACGFSYQRVEFEDKRRSQKSVDEFKKRFEGKLKKGGSIVMSW
jgi:transposase